MKRLASLLLFTSLLVGCEADQEQFATMAQQHAAGQGFQSMMDMQSLTKGYSTLPSSVDMNKFIVDATSTPEKDCAATAGNDTLIRPRVMRKDAPEKEVKQKPKKESSLAADGAKKVLATMFQSCNALDEMITSETPRLKGVRKVRTGSKKIPYKRKLYNTKQYVNSHIILSKLNSDPGYPGAMCTDMTKKPPVYGYGSRKYPNRSGEVNLFSKGAGGARSSRPAAMIDCSSFISVALGSQGLKVNENSKKFESLTTTNFEQQVGRKNSCLKHATFKGTDSVKPGDMINVAASHIVMIDSVSEDPLGIKKYSKLGKCNSISISDFDFTYIHSGAIKNSYGPSRVHVSTHKGGTMFNNLRLAAIKQCKKAVAKADSKVSSKSFRTNRKFSIIRHDSKNPSCVTDKKVKLRNEECVNSCLEERKS